MVDRESTMTPNKGSEDLRERLADLCHEQWSGWMEYLFSKCPEYKAGNIQAYDGALIIPKWAVDRWQRQLDTPYDKLSKEEQDSDRKEADRFLSLLTEARQVKESYPPNWKHCTIHLNPETGEMHSDGDHSVREWIQEKMGTKDIQARVLLYGLL
jgi:hypothetical protein